MPTSTRRTDGSNRRALIAVATPVALAAVAGALTMVTPANAASASSPLPFATSVCSTGTAASTSSPSPSASASRSATATPQASASASGSGTAKAKTAKSPGASASPSASSSTGSAAGNPASPPPTPMPTPSASNSSSGGFWGWLNGVWTWIFGSQQLPHAAAAPVLGAAFANSSTKNNSGTGTSVVAPVRSAVAGVGSIAGGTKTITGGGAVNQAANGAAAQAAPSPTASCIPQSQIKAGTANSDGNTAAIQPWHLSTPSMTMYSLTYNGVTTIQTVNGPEQVLDFTAAKATLLSMVTYSRQGGGKLQYVDGGQGQTVTLENVHLWSTSFSADVLGLLHQTFTPQNPGLLTVLRGITIPLPLLFTNVEAENAFLNTGSILIPGFNGHGN